MQMPEVHYQTVQDAVYTMLKKEIMTMRLVPGTVMSTQEMATRLNVSRTPVRESFLKLQEESLVEVTAQRKTRVSRIDPKRVEEERFIRESLEIAVIDPFLKYCTKRDFEVLRDYIAEQRECCSKERAVQFVELDNKMHRYIFEVAGQGLAWNTLSNVSSHDGRIRVLTSENTDTMRGVVSQHEKLIQLLEQKEAQKAKQEVTCHVRKIQQEIGALEEKYPNYFTSDDCGLNILSWI